MKCQISHTTGIYGSKLYIPRIVTCSLVIQKVDFETLTWKAFNQFKDDPLLRKIGFDCKVSGVFPFFSDPDRLEIVIDNLISNAINFYDSNKARPFIKIHITLKKDVAVLEFIDNGIGIGKQHIDHIFNMFYKASHYSKGAGLGLFIVKETLEKMGGLIEVETIVVTQSFASIMNYMCSFI